MIAFQDLEVRYGATVALKELNLSLGEGIIGLLGPNGSGKSTLLKTLLGLLKPYRGSGTVMGMQFGDAASFRLRRSIGYMPEYDALIEDVSAYEQVAFWGELSGLSREQARDRSHEALYFVGLDESRYRKASGYSTGMRQRVKLAQALVHSPKLVFLDEPTNGLDPTGRRKMLDLVQKVRAEMGTSIIIASHLLEDVERVSDQLVILGGGEVRAHGPVSSLRHVLSKRFEMRFLEPLTQDQEAGLAKIGNLLENVNGVYDVELYETDPIAPFKWAEAAGATIMQLMPRYDRLDEILIRAIRGLDA